MKEDNNALAQQTNITNETTDDKELIAKLQQKKNKLRKALKEKGILPKGAHNDFDNYDYFSEAQYKELFLDLFSQHGLDYNSSEEDVTMFKGTDKQPFGVSVKIRYELFDIDTGYSEVTYHTGIAIDKGDKAIYKASTGSLKKWLANNFMVATKDDPEREEDIPKNKQLTKNVNKTKTETIKGTISPIQDKKIRKLFEKDKLELAEIMKKLKKVKIEELTREEASTIIKNKEEK